MRRGLERRLVLAETEERVAAAAAAVAGERAAAVERVRLRRIAVRGGILRKWFPPEDAGPALEHALLCADAAATALELAGDCAQRRAADEALASGDADEGLGELCALRRLCDEYEEGRAFDRDGASAQELLAWTFFRNSRAGRERE